MPEGRIANLIVLCEDLTQQRLIRGYLKQLKQRARYMALPGGKGSGEQHVRKELPTAVQSLRSWLGKRVSALLVVMIDADLYDKRGQVTLRPHTRGGSAATERARLAQAVDPRVAEG